MTISDQKTVFKDLAPLIHPRSVAVIGASEQSGNLGGVAVTLMQKFGYRGKILPVHPKHTSVHGLPCVASVADLSEPVDLAIIATGAELVIEIVRQCADAEIRFGVVWAGGYSEIGEEGSKLEEALVAVCRETGFSIVGPNCLGVIESRNALVASFASFLVKSDTLLTGNIAMISQSGGLATMAQAMAQDNGFGFGLTVSAGNEATLTVSDYIHAAAMDDSVRVIAAYIEGIRDGARFIDALETARGRDKQVVILKGGRSAVSAQAVAAHTGALAGEARVWEAIAREFGIISVNSLEELLEVSLQLSTASAGRVPQGRGVAVVTFGGGSGVLAADQCSAHGLNVPKLSPDTLAKLKPLVPPIAAVHNPIDLTPQTFNQEKWFATFPEALYVIASDPAVDVILCQFGPQAQRGAETARAVVDLRSRTDKALVLAWPQAPHGIPEILHEAGVFVFHGYERAIIAIARIASANDDAALRVPRPSHARFDWSLRLPGVRSGAVISENEAHRVLKSAGVSVAPGRLATSHEDAVAAAREIGFPLAAKGISSTVTHRAAAGLLALNIRDEKELQSAYSELVSKAATAQAELDGIYLQKMISKGLEIIVSGFRDPVFGPMISCGSGGVMTELLDDIVLARAPLDEAGARRLVDKLRIVTAAEKFEKGADRADLARFISRISELVYDAPWRRFVIEINPVKWSAGHTVAVDGLIVVEDV